MADFMIRFLLCNLSISGIIGVLLAAERLFGNCLSARMRYNLWFLLLGLLAVPFLPFRPAAVSRMLSALGGRFLFPSPEASALAGAVSGAHPSGFEGRIADFAVSVSGKTPSAAGAFLSAVWIAGIAAATIAAAKSALRLHAIKKSALPLQNPTVRRLYQRCLDEMRICRNIPVHSSAFLKSPMITGLFRPCVYLPIHLISDYCESDMRYILLHELCHYKHRDALAGYLMHLAVAVYWFNPFVWYAMREMRSDREAACDVSVLQLLQEDDYEAYGNTLIHFAAKVSLMSSPFAVGLGADAKQLKKRLLAIASYRKPTPAKRIKSAMAFLLTAVLLLGLAPLASTYASDGSRSPRESAAARSDAKNTVALDLSAYFDGYEGSFVLYDSKKDIWSVYNAAHAALRVSPDSTYKLYDALFALEEGVITQGDSFLAWDETVYPFEEWNRSQTLRTAMESSVNWYFEALDERLTAPCVARYLRRIGYGNETIGNAFPTYWQESSLAISPMEQVELLVEFQSGGFGFAPENIRAVKDAIRLSSSDSQTLYGKTGTGRIDGQDVNGWFIGFVETADNTWFFAANIRADSNASGSSASQIAMSVLSDMHILAP